jgi:hypothetical protein
MYVCLFFVFVYYVRIYAHMPVCMYLRTYICMYIRVYDISTFSLNVLTLRDPKNIRMLTDSNMAPVTPLTITTVGIREMHY